MCPSSFLGAVKRNVLKAHSTSYLIPQNKPAWRHTYTDASYLACGDTWSMMVFMMRGTNSDTTL